VLAQGRLKAFGPLLVIWGLAVLVLLETRDLGGGLLYFGIFLAMLFVATGRLAFVAIGLVLFIVGSIGVWKVTPHVQERVTVWEHPWSDHPVYCPLTGRTALRQNCQGYQIVQSMYSIGHGGYTGTGLGRGTVTTLGGTELIPYAKTDFIFSVIAQEFGLVGTAAFLLVYMVFVLRGIRIALLAQDGFSKLLALGLTFAFALQAFIIVGGILRIIPLTGITLPFVSYGGSSVVANFLLLAGLLLVSNRANREALR
jgi:cell division protein FtsW (lipid II flippase)